MGSVVVVLEVGEVVSIALAERRQTRRFPTVVHLNEPADVFRICPVFLQVVPLIDTGLLALCVTTAETGIAASESGKAIGSIPVRAAAPTDTAWQTMHISTTNGT